MPERSIVIIRTIPHKKTVGNPENYGEWENDSGSSGIN